MSVFSSALANSGFLVERSLPATAIIFPEPETSSSQRRENFYQTDFDRTSEDTQGSCSRPKLPIGQALDPILNKIPEPITRIHSKFEMTKARILDKLGLQCLFPKLIHPFNPIFKYVRCLLGINSNDGFLSVPSCDYRPTTICSKQDVQEQEITHSLYTPYIPTTDLRIRTIDSCFPGLERVSYGARILIKLVDDQPCDDVRYNNECNELIETNRIVSEHTCETPG